MITVHSEQFNSIKSQFSLKGAETGCIFMTPPLTLALPRARKNSLISKEEILRSISGTLLLMFSPLPSPAGGEFTRKADVTFQPGNEKLSITQEFKGIDEHDHLVVSTVLEGRVPEVPRGATVQLDKYSEIYQYANNRKAPRLRVSSMSRMHDVVDTLTTATSYSVENV